LVPELTQTTASPGQCSFAAASVANSPFPAGLPAAAGAAGVAHFLVKLVFAAPASFWSAALVSQDALASFSHFMKLVMAAPASFFSAAWLSQVASAANASVA
jgi:hypothetical protein